MKKYTHIPILAGVLVLLLVLLSPMVSVGASTLYIDITATGSELDITCNVTAWAVGTVVANDNISTRVTWGNVTNNTSQAVEITVHGNNMLDIATGSTENWTLSNPGTAGASTFAMRLAINDDDDNFDYIIVHSDNAPYSKLAYNAGNSLANAASWTFGLQFLAPSSGLGNDPMVMTNDAGTSHAVADADNGLVFIATVAP